MLSAKRVICFRQFSLNLCKFQIRDVSLIAEIHCFEACYFIVWLHISNYEETTENENSENHPFFRQEVDQMFAFTGWFNSWFNWCRFLNRASRGSEATASAYRSRNKSTNFRCPDERNYCVFLVRFMIIQTYTKWPLIAISQCNTEYGAVKSQGER
jgi:hypothetical protein